ncbi:MBL fold metallo-hydrolase [Micromonospora rifamycinica]|uniref:L-ascorbate metabolism protein UlaG, beta-lactamase superfamily n=1 Tax=Micromonospora rifamycinica TaxID=291594 RepID=A0A109IFL8_9ACTN|nr:MBL fold metallo-hydrolase [Micromonospora rifamycinica]KWV29656.1 Zn-dependent hydrolase [Micromonospora rifamycinica]SCG49824.1 L-ascorbate metabolism protein UlaG, beta-lactamase superfamily [Micromonospora rifamycinica]
MRKPAERAVERTPGGRLWRVAALAAVAGLAWTARDVPAALGGRLTGARAERAARSAQFRDGTFHNRVAVRTMPGGDPDRSLLRELLFGQQRRRPTAPVPLLRPAPAPTTGVDRELSIVWYGHASALVEIEGHRVLIDPVWSDRCSPSAAVGPKRLHAPPVSLDELPTVDAILISHDHYDHLDMTTVRELVRRQSAPFLVPLGVGAHLDRWGVPADRIIELDWSERHRVGGLEITATAAQHFSGRGLRRDGTLWSSWVVAGAHRKVFYTGDSGYFDGYAEIGAEHGPFDVTLMQIGAYDRAWPGIHMFPEEAVTAHLELRGDLLVPVHWATFNLALHDWSEPVDRLWAEAKTRDVRLAVPRPGERVVVDDPQPVDGWWQTVA